MGEQPDGAGRAPDVRLVLTHGPDGSRLLADGRALSVPPRASATEVGLAAARRHAGRSERDLRVEVVDGAATTVVAVSPHGTVTLLEAPATEPLPRLAVPEEPVTAVDRTTVHVPAPRPAVPTGPPVSAWVSPPSSTRPRRPVSSLVIAGLVAVAVLVGAVGTGVATLSSSHALPDSCRPVTVYAVGGQGGSSDVLKGVTDPLSRQFGEKVSVVTVPAPPTGGSFASAESEAVGSLATAMGDHVDGCPTGSLMLFGYSQGAQVAGDLASRVGTGLEPRVPARLVQAVGLFGDPARSPLTRAVPDGTTGQGTLPPRAVGFGSLDARTIEICAPGDPVCDSPPNAASPPLEQAVASPVHGSYQQLPVAAGTTAPQWAAASLGKVVAAVPTTSGPATPSARTAPQSGPVATTTPSSTETGSTGAGSIPDTPTNGPGATTTAPNGGGAGAGTGGSSGEGGGTYDQGGATGAAGSSVTTTTAAPPAATGSSAAGGTADGAGVSTRRSGSASSTTTPDEAGPSGSSDSSSTRSSAGTGPSGTTGTGSSGTVGQGSAGTSDTSVAGSGSETRGPSTTGSTSTGRGPSTTSSDDGYGTATGLGAGETGSSATGSGSSAPASTRARSGSASEEPTTTTSAGSRGRGTGDSKTGDSSDTRTGNGDGATGTATGAAWSLVKGLAGFKSTPWNNQNATDPSTASSPNVPGRQAVKFEMPGGGKRTEAEPDVPVFQQGQTAFVGYSGFFDAGFPTTTDTWQVIMQFKQPGTGSPPLAVEVGKGQLRLANNGHNQKDFCPVTDGAFSFQVGVTFGGTIEAWCNGRQTLAGYRTPESNVQGSAYLKTGIYRDESIKQDSTLFLNDLKVGKSLDSVSGLAGVDEGAM